RDRGDDPDDRHDNEKLDQGEAVLPSHRGTSKPFSAMRVPCAAEHERTRSKASEHRTLPVFGRSARMCDGDCPYPSRGAAWAPRTFLGPAPKEKRRTLGRVRRSEGVRAGSGRGPDADFAPEG